MEVCVSSFLKHVTTKRSLGITSALLATPNETEQVHGVEFETPDMKEDA